MKALLGICALALSVIPVAQATSTTLTVNATATPNATTYNISGTATLTNIGNGTITGTLPISALSGINATIPYTITLPGGTLTGSVTLPVAALINGSGTGSGTVTGGSGAYAGASGSFPTLTGGGSIGAAGITLSFTGAGTINTSGGTTTTPSPTITAVLDAASNTATIAEGGLFIVKGTNLSPSGYTPLSPNYPTSSGGITIAFTPVAGGASTNAYIIYLYNQNGTNQLAAILPSTLPVGNYNVVVTNGTASAPFQVAVAQNKPTLFTQDSSGTGLVVIQNYISATELDINRFTTGVVNQTTISPAKPGQTLIAWGTGLGPITLPDNTPTTYDFHTTGNVNVQVIVGGITITPSFAGLNGYPGEVQINFTLPATIPTGCTVPFQISVNGVLSNQTFLSIAPNSTSSACVAPGLTSAQLQNLDNGGTITGGGFELEQFSSTETVSGQTEAVKFALAGGGFTQVTGFQLANAPAVTTQPGACQVITTTTSNSTTFSIPTAVNVNYLDAGAVTLNGPSGSNITNAALTETANDYALTIAEQLTPPITGVTLPGIPNASIVPGTYTLKGAGGKDVQAFNASIALGSLLTVTNGLPSSVNRNAGLTLNWTGGNSTDTVEIFGSSGNTSSTTSFICFTTAGPGTFTVPSSILTQLPTSTTGALAVFSGPTPASGNGLFSVNLTAGGSISNATFLALLGVEGTAAYQ